MSEQIRIETQVARRDLKPYVVLRWGSEEGRLTPAEARQHALSILAAAEAAEGDAFIVQFLAERIEVEPRVAIQILADFRGYRARLAEDKP